MAALVLYSVMNRIIERLRFEAVQGNAMPRGVEDELRELEETISSTQALVPDAEKNLVHQWLKDLEDVVYEADDLVDKLSYKALRRIAEMRRSDNCTKQVRTFFSTSSNQLSLRCKLGVKIKAINKRITEIGNYGRTILHLKETHEENILVVTGGKESTPSSYVPEEEEEVIIGRDRDKMAIKQYLLDAAKNSEENVQVIPIVSTAGIGRTTFTQLVFNDVEVVKHFDLRLWAKPSDDFDVRSLIGKIVKSATKKDFENLKMHQLKKKLGKLVSGKRYLLVLEDVWSTLQQKEEEDVCSTVDHNEWMSWMSKCANGSRIIITTHSYVVAQFMGKTIKPYTLDPLDQEESWALFKKVAFKNGEEPINSQIVEIGKRIVERCQGSPLTIRIIGRMLRSKYPETEWSTFLDTNFSRIPKYLDISLALKLVYDNLPSHLKHCFAYCSIFPKDFEIDVKTLINLWMAEGFIYSSQEKHILEDVGYEYLQNLCWAFCQKVVKDENGIVGKFRMSSFMHLLATSAAFLISATLDGRQCDRIDRKSTQHVSFHFHLDSSSQVPTSLVEANRIRTILLPNQMHWETEGKLSQSICDKMISNCKWLRVLDLHNSGIKMVPDSIGKLKHLRYLDVSQNTAIKSLPNSITMLHHLTVLKLSSCYGLQELPRDIKKLMSLRHLEIDWCYSLTHLPSGLGELTQLQTLSEFVLTNNNSNSCSLRELARLNNLRGELKMKKLENGMYDDPKAAILKEKEHLTSLTLAWDFDVNEATAENQLECLEPHSNIKELALVRYEGIKFSGWLSTLYNLVKFSLRKCKCQNLLPLSHLSSLKVLMVYEMTNLKYISNKYENDNSSSLAAFFPSLEELRLTELPNLEGWWEHDNSVSSLPSFPRLSKLIIEDCPKLSSMPLYTHLQEWLVLDNTSLDTFQRTMNASGSSQVPSETNKEWSAASTSSAVFTSSFFPLSRLRSLCITGIKKLDITYSDEIKWEGLRNLRFLRFDYLPKLIKLPEGLQHVITLQELHIWRCNMETLPKWIGDFKLLTRLGISVCPYLKSLPEEIRSLSSLVTLEIVDCPILLRRCQRETGADWHKIEHIPDLLLQQPQSSSSSSSVRN